MIRKPRKYISYTFIHLLLIILFLFSGFLLLNENKNYNIINNKTVDKGRKCNPKKLI